MSNEAKILITNVNNGGTSNSYNSNGNNQRDKNLFRCNYHYYRHYRHYNYFTNTNQAIRMRSF